jgi:hypothetical protein
MKTIYSSKDGKVSITVRQYGCRNIAWALHVDGQYKGSKVLPANNTAIAQNFGFPAKDFTAI